MIIENNWVSGKARSYVIWCHRIFLFGQPGTKRSTPLDFHPLIYAGFYTLSYLMAWGFHCRAQPVVVDFRIRDSGSL